MNLRTLSELVFSFSFSNLFFYYNIEKNAFNASPEF